MYSKLIEFGSPEFGSLLDLRDEVLRKPLGLEFTCDQISQEYDSMHLGCYSKDHILLGVLILKPLSKKVVKMRQVAVKPEMQNQGIGRFLVVSSEVIAKGKGYKEIVLSARLKAVSFYNRLAYEAVSDIYIEVGIEHKKMRKLLSLI